MRYLLNFKFTKYGFTNALWSLIPIFPIWSLFPGVGLGELINLVLDDCQLSYKITYHISYTIALTAVFLFTNRRKKLPSKKENWNFKIWCLSVYTFINISLFIYIVEPEIVCTGDGQTALGVIYSAPFATLSIVILGLITDFTRNKKRHSKRFEGYQEE